MESTMCHICNAYVPKQYLQEHLKSFKHKTYMKIANTVLQRIKKHINYENNDKEIEVNESIYFCAPCITVVNFKEKKNHEKSLNHRNSVFLDKCLSSFLNLYSDNIEISDNDLDTLDEESTKVIASNESSKQEKSEARIKDDFDLNSYFNMLKDKYHMKINVKVINKGQLEIEIEGSKIKVTANNFLGLKNNSMDISTMQCVVCDVFVRCGDIVKHIMGPVHMCRVSTPMQDIHCKREIGPLWQHCVLCNIMISDYNYHPSNPIHIKWLEEALNSDDAKSR